MTSSAAAASHHSAYLVGGHLHRPHGQHCEDHGALTTQ